MRIVKIFKLEDAWMFFENLLRTKDKEIAFDIEATGRDIVSSKIRLMQLKLRKLDIVFIVVGEEVIRKVFQAIMNIPGVVLIGHNLKFDLSMIFKLLDEDLKVNVFDTMLAHRLTCVGLSDCPYLISLKDLIKKYLDIKISKEERILFETEEEISEAMYQYAAIDVYYLHELKDRLLEEIRKVNHERILELENKLVPVVASMERHGIRVDVEKFKKLSDEALENFNRARNELMQMVLAKLKEKYWSNNLLHVIENVFGISVKTKKARIALESMFVSSDDAIEIIVDKINFASSKQLLYMLRNLFDIDTDSTSQKALNRILFSDIGDEARVFIEKVIEMREHYKRYTSFGQAYIDKFVRADGKIHAEFNQLGTNTGRFSSSNPNLQQVPREKEYRHCFIAENDSWRIITADYSQMELRMIFDLAKEQVAIETYKAGEDLHRKTASLIFDKPVSEISSEERNIGKTLNFAVIYGSGPGNLSRTLGIPNEKARKLLKQFFEAYKNTKSFIDMAGDLIVKKGYSITPFGRKRFFDIPKVFKDVKEYNVLVSEVKRQGVNHIIQGGCADAVKLAMLDIYYNNPYNKYLRIVMQVHDEIVVEVHKDILPEAVEFVKSCMIKAFERFLSEIPAEVSAVVSNTWEKE